MTRDAKESLTALAAVLFIFGAMWLIPLVLNDVYIPRWVQPVGFGLQIALLIFVLMRRRRTRSR